MTNVERLTNLLMTLLLDLNIGLSLPLRRTIATVIACLLEGTDAHLSDLADALPDIQSDQMAKEQRLRRLLSHPNLSPQRFLPAYLHLLRPVLQTLPELVLSMDRTNWNKRKHHVNILMVAVHFQGRALPLYWTVRDCAGHAGMTDWKTVLMPVITAIQADPVLRNIPLRVTADREFASPQLAKWLMHTSHVDSVLRLKRSEYLRDQAQEIKLADLLAFFPRGETRTYPRTTVTKASSLQVNVTIAWEMRFEEPLILMSPVEGGPLSISTYQRRFGIEAMFKDQKSNGFNLEQTKVTDPKRIETLLMFTTFAHIFCTVEGYRKETHGETKKNGLTAVSFALADVFSSASPPSSKRFEKQTAGYSHNVSIVCQYL